MFQSVYHLFLSIFPIEKIPIEGVEVLLMMSYKKQMI